MNSLFLYQVRTKYVRTRQHISHISCELDICCTFVLRCEVMCLCVFLFLRRMGKNEAKLTTLSTYFIHVCQFYSTAFAIQGYDKLWFLPIVPVVTIARAVPTGGPRCAPTAQAAVVYGRVGMSTRPDPRGSGVVEIATRNGIIPVCFPTHAITHYHVYQVYAYFFAYPIY